MTETAATTELLSNVEYERRYYHPSSPTKLADKISIRIRGTGQARTKCRPDPEFLPGLSGTMLSGEQRKVAWSELPKTFVDSMFVAGIKSSEIKRCINYSEDPHTRTILLYVDYTK